MGDGTGGPTGVLVFELGVAGGPVRRDAAHAGGSASHADSSCIETLGRLAERPSGSAR